VAVGPDTGGMGTWQGRLAWCLCAATVLCAGIQVALLAGSGGQLFTVDNFLAGFPTMTVTAITASCVGALVVGRYRQHPIGWLFTIWATGAAAGFLANAYVLRHSDSALGHTWDTALAVRASVLFGSPYTLAIGAIIFLLVPDGRLPSRRWRPALAVPILGLVLHIATVLSLRPERFSPGRVVDAGVGALTEGLAVATFCTVVLGLPLAGLALVRRQRVARGVQRQQLRWIAASGVSLVIAAVIAIVALARSLGDQTPWIAAVPLLFAYVSVPVCTGVAILRYRLYDIDLIINRAIVLVAVIAFVTVGYVAAVVLIGAALGRGVQGRFWPSLLALIVVALAFQPLRHRVLRWADRIVYGRRAEPYEALADFSHRIGSAASTAELLPLLSQAAASATGAQRADIQVEFGGTSALPTSWPPEDRGTHPDANFQLALTDNNERMGVLRLVMPPGRPLRHAERRLLEGFAEQAGLALRNLSLEAELRARVEEAAAQAGALEASRRRLLGARDAERHRVAATIEGTVLARLASLNSDLKRASDSSLEESVALLERLDSRTQETLDALRAVTHGLLPATLSRRGLVAALRDHLGGLGVGDVFESEAQLVGRRFRTATESAGYFCCLAALAELARPSSVWVGQLEGMVVIEVAGVTDSPERSGDQNLSVIDHDQAALPGTAWFGDPAVVVDRVEAAGGTFQRRRTDDGRVIVHAELPAVELLPA
jgi:signal transduction histidine kinase